MEPINNGLDFFNTSPNNQLDNNSPVNETFKNEIKKIAGGAAGQSVPIEPLKAYLALNDKIKAVEDQTDQVQKLIKHNPNISSKCPNCPYTEVNQLIKTHAGSIARDPNLAGRLAADVLDLNYKYAVNYTDIDGEVELPAEISLKLASNDPAYDKATALYLYTAASYGLGSFIPSEIKSKVNNPNVWHHIQTYDRANPIQKSDFGY